MTYASLQIEYIRLLEIMNESADTCRNTLIQAIRVDGVWQSQKNNRMMRIKQRAKEENVEKNKKKS